jgi:hypothetical protein
MPGKAIQKPSAIVPRVIIRFMMFLPIEVLHAHKVNARMHSLRSDSPKTKCCKFRIVLPAAGTNATTEIVRLRHVPLAALEKGYITGRGESMSPSREGVKAQMRWAMLHGEIKSCWICYASRATVLF